MLAYERRLGDDHRRVVANFGEEAVSGVGVGWDGDWVVEVATSVEREGQPFDGPVAGAEAVVLRDAAASRTPGRFGVGPGDAEVDSRRRHQLSRRQAT